MFRIAIFAPVIRSWLCFFLFVLALSVGEARAQPILSDTVNGAALTFDHVLSIYEWRGEFRFASISPTAVAIPPLRTHSSNNDMQFDSVYFYGKSRFLQDNAITSTEATGFVLADEPIGGGVPFKPFLMFYGSSYVTSSLPGVVTSSLITHQTDGFGIGGLRSQLPESDVNLSVGGGITRQSQPELSAYGAIVRGDMSAPTEMLTDNTLLTASALADERFYNQRSQRFSNDRIAIRSVSTLLGPDDKRTPGIPTMGSRLFATNAAQLNLGLLRRDYFFAADSTSGPNPQAIKQERTEYSLLVSDSLRYPLAEEHLSGDASLEFEPRSIVRRSDAAASSLFSATSVSTLTSLLAPNEVASLRLAAGGHIDYESDMSRTFGAEAQMRYEEKSENVSLLSAEIPNADPAFVSKLTQTLDQASYSTRSTAAGVSIHASPSVRDLIHLESNLRLLNYDTPSDLNDDDHDELVTSLDLRYNRILSDDLTASLDLTASQTHLVYLKSDRSAQNNVTRSLTLASEASYGGQGVLAHVHGEVFANYTILDYLNSLPSLQAVGNYLLRGVSITDSLLVPLGHVGLANTGPLTIEEGLSLRVSERGSYNTDAFSERRDARVTEFGATVLLGITSFDGLSVRAGARAFVLSQSGRSTSGLSPAPLFAELQRQTLIGPMMIVSLWRGGTASPTLSGSVWYARNVSQSFDVPSYYRSAQLESHLMVEWVF